MESVIPFLLLFPIFMVAVVIHEVSHGWMALCLGDPTARMLGRLTLNPLRHIDPVGTILLPLLLFSLRAPFVFGWAKPVPVNPQLLRHPKRDMIWVGVAGPSANFLLAGLTALILHSGEPLLWPLAVYLAKYLILINLVLGVFNLLPIPPLDGSRVLAGLLPPSLARWMLRHEGLGILILVALVGCGVTGRLIFPVVERLAGWLGL